MGRPPREPATSQWGHTAPYLPGGTNMLWPNPFSAPHILRCCPRSPSYQEHHDIPWFLYTLHGLWIFGFPPLILGYPALSHHDVWWHVNPYVSLPPQRPPALISCHSPWHSAWYIPARPNRNPFCRTRTRFAPFLPRCFVGSFLRPRTEAAENRTGRTGGRLGLKLPPQQADCGDNLRF